MASVEWAIGTRWVVVVFAGVIAYLTPRFADIAEQTARGPTKAEERRRQQQAVHEQALRDAVVSAVRQELAQAHPHEAEHEQALREEIVAAVQQELAQAHWQEVERQRQQQPWWRSLWH